MIQTLFGSLDEERKPSFIERMKEAVSRTRENLAERIEDVVSIGKEIDRSTLDDLEATLIGADLLNLDRISDLGAPVASIGGAGTFDGIFLTGILAVLIAGIASPSRPRPA